MKSRRGKKGTVIYCARILRGQVMARRKREKGWI